MTYDASSSLIGYQPLALAWQAVLAAHHAAGIGAIFDAYDHWCKQYDIDPNLAFAQACHESAFFTSMRWTQEWNPAGLGIVANNTPPNPFKSPQEGIQAHIEHLLCYTHLIDDCPADHAHLADRRHFFHDGMPRLQDLERFHVDAHGVKVSDRMWAVPNGWPDTTQDPQDYVRSIVTIANSIGATPVSTVPWDRVHISADLGPTRTLDSIKWGIVHDTEGHFDGDELVLTSAGPPVESANILIGRQPGQCVLIAPLTTTAWAAGNDEVGIQAFQVELSKATNESDYTDYQYTKLAECFRYARAQGMVNVPFVYLGLHPADVDGGPEPDDAGIIGHAGVPNPAGLSASPPWGGFGGHTDPGPDFDWPRFIGMLGNAPPPPTGHQIDGHTVGDGHYSLYTSVDEAHRLIVFGKCLTDEHDEYMVIDAPADAKAKNLNKIAIPVVAVRYERQVAIWDHGRTAAPWDTRIPLTGEHVGPADDLLVGATLYAMQLVGYTP